jgi:hypothetical protein
MSIAIIIPKKIGNSGWFFRDANWYNACPLISQIYSLNWV